MRLNSNQLLGFIPRSTGQRKGQPLKAIPKMEIKSSHSSSARSITLRDIFIALQEVYPKMVREAINHENNSGSKVSPEFLEFDLKTAFALTEIKAESEPVGLINDFAEKDEDPETKDLILEMASEIRNFIEALNSENLKAIEGAINNFFKISERFIDMESFDHHTSEYFPRFFNFTQALLVNPESTTPPL